jgi:enoyl-CoA hydratase
MPRQPLCSVQFEFSSGCARLRLCRPDHYNALDISTLAEILVILEEAAGMQMPLVLSGEGQVFSLGCDVRELAGFSTESAATYSRLGQQVVRTLESWPGVTIAHLTGYALGTGLELALGCDLLVGAPGVRIGLPGLAWALVPCLGGLRRLHQRVGPEVSSDLFLRGHMLDAESALRAGLLSRIVLEDQEVTQLANSVTDFSASAVSAIRELRLRHHGPADASSETIEADLFAQSFTNGECQRRLRSLL